MNKLNICASRIPGMTHAQYCRYFRDNHARLVLGTEPVARYMKSYVQQHVFDGAYRSQAPSARYDSVSHISAATMQDQLAAAATREYKEIIAPDEPNFSDPRTAMFLMYEEVPLDVPIRGPSGFRLLQYLASKPEVSTGVLHTRWAEAHGAILAEDKSLLQSVRRVILHKGLPGPMGTPTYNGLCEVGFLSMEEVPALCSYAREIEARLQDSVELEKGFFLLAEAVPVHGTLW
jgi:hypothetical protein